LLHVILSGAYICDETIGALANLSTATTADRGVVAALTQANSHPVKQLEENASELRGLKALLNLDRRDKRFPRSSTSSSSNYCWTHGYKVGMHYKGQVIIFNI
jgi:hypothetical protein